MIHAMSVPASTCEQSSRTENLQAFEKLDTRQMIKYPYKGERIVYIHTRMLTLRSRNASNQYTSWPTLIGRGLREVNSNVMYERFSHVFFVLFYFFLFGKIIINN